MKNRQLTSEELSALATFCNRGYEDQPLWSEIEPGLWMGGTADDDVTEYGHRRPAITNEHFDTVVTLYAQANPVDWYEPPWVCWRFHTLETRMESWTKTTGQVGVNRPGFVGDFILWKRGWSHGQKQQDRSEVFG